MNALLSLIEKLLVGIFALGFIVLIAIGVIRYNSGGSEEGGSWAETKKHNTIEAYLEFLRECQTCRHEQEAEAALDELQRARGLVTRLQRGEMHERESISLPLFAPDGHLMTALAGSVPGVWDVPKGTRHEFGRHAFTADSGEQIKALAYSSDSKRIAAGLSGSEHGQLVVWDGQTGELVASNLVEGYDVKAVAFGAQGVLGWLADGPVGIWDPATGKFLRATHEGATAMAFTRTDDKRVLLLSAAGRELWFWDPSSMEPVRQITINSDHNLLGLSRDGRWIVYTEGTVLEIWDTRTATLIATLNHPEGEIISFCREPKKGWLAVGTHEGILYLWDPALPTPLAQVSAHEGPVEQLACSAQGRVTSVAWDSAKIWDMEKLRKGNIKKPTAAPAPHHGE